MNLTQKIFTCLSNHSGRKLTAREIAAWIFKTYPVECEKKKARSQATVNILQSNQALIQQIVAEIGSQRKSLEKRYATVKTTEERPRKYYYTIQTDQAEVEEIEAEAKAGLQTDTIPNIKAINTHEHDLYPMLSTFLWAEYSIYSKRIDEKRSSNSNGRNGNIWLYPDLVAMEDLTHSWEQKIKDCVQQYADKKTKLWSFEVKPLVNRSNVREAFFQTVSNSSWANYSYLVAGELQGSNTKQELQVLCSLHGIGFIQLNTENPVESQILIPARERTEIDWDTANRLAKENSDFRDFIEEVIRFYQTGKTKTSDWNIRK